MFQRVGVVAYKNDLTNTLSLCAALGHPQKKFKSVHVAGTNGKGSSSHMLAAILQRAGYKTGLYTSPHLKSFTERIRINGKEVSQSFVVDFVDRVKPLIEEIKPSFFEITVVMAFDYFVLQQVDVAVIEVGLGGRLDSTNVIIPVVSLITNISFDHKDLLGDTLPAIAFEKAGIIKKNTPVVLSEQQPEVLNVFKDKAALEHAELSIASDRFDFDGSQLFDKHTQHTLTLTPELKGDYQRKNIPGVIMTVEKLRAAQFQITDNHIQEGIQFAACDTGLKGRWQKLNERPLIICDTGHNEAGMKMVLEQISKQRYNRLFMVIGFVRDKDLNTILQMLPRDAYYFFCQANIPRALEAQQLASQAVAFHLHGEAVENVNEAIERAKNYATDDDMIFIGGSTFVVAEIENL